MLDRDAHDRIVARLRSLIPGYLADVRIMHERDLAEAEQRAVKCRTRLAEIAEEEAYINETIDFLVKYSTGVPGV